MPTNFEIFDDAFWLTLSGAVFAFGGLVTNGILKSRCKTFSCFGMACERDVAPPGQEPQVEIEIPPMMAPKKQEIKETS